jgi:hypothetical protein
MELNLSGYRFPRWGDFGVALYAARPTVWLAYKKRKVFNDYSWLFVNRLPAMADKQMANKNALEICEIGGRRTMDRAAVRERVMHQAIEREVERESPPQPARARRLIRVRTKTRVEVEPGF